MAVLSDTRYQLRRLIRVLSTFQAKCIAQKRALTVIGQKTPEVRARLTASRIQDLVQKGQAEADKVVQEELNELEQALLNGTDFLPAPKTYLTKH
jgi:hypothetical protein